MSSKILIVEDDQDIRRNLKRLLEIEGHTVDVAENGQVALEFLQTVADLPRMIFLDLMMPVMDGFEFREKQCSDARLAHIPVAIMTANDRTDAKRQKISAQIVLRKPASVEDILDAVAKLA